MAELDRKIVQESFWKYEVPVAAQILALLVPGFKFPAQSILSTKFIGNFCMFKSGMLNKFFATAALYYIKIYLTISHMSA